MKLSKLVLLFGLTIVFFACAGQISAQIKANPQTVTDYYLLLRPENLSILEAVKNRRSLIETEDLKNGYLRLEGSWEGWAEIALFRRTNREAVIAVNYVDCGPECGGAVQFLTYTDGQWRDITAEVMPEIEDADILAAYNRIKTRDDEDHSLDDLPSTYWKIPQKGTALKLLVGEASASSDKTLFSFTWNGAHFTKTTE